MTKICSKCGSTLDDAAKFCPQCGNEYGVAPVCTKCGQELTPNDLFCPNCGADQNPTLTEADESYIKKGFNAFASTINTMAGESGEVEIHVKDLFSDVFKKHTQEEKDELFVCGTSKTTPKESEMITEWPHPWLFSRVFLMFAVVFAGLYFMVMKLGNTNSVPGSMFVGALLIPLTVMIFFWEMNVPRNVSIVDVISVFFVGGILSLVLTLLLYKVFPVEQLDHIGAVIVGIVEEVGKVLAVAYYIKKRNIKYKLNGLLLGSCVGAGFAVFETAGYAFESCLSGGLEIMMETLFLRGVLAIGGHVVWAAISGVGLVVAKGDEPLKTDHLLSVKFLKFLILVITLHAVWDMPTLFGMETPFIKWGVLTVIALATVLVLLGSGLRQVSVIVQKAQEAERKEICHKNR